MISAHGERKMKPIILIAKETDGKITMEIDEFKRLIEQTFEMGEQYGMLKGGNPLTIQPTWGPFKNGNITCEDRTE